MDFMGIVKAVGTGLVRSIPGGGLILDVVNEYLPADKKLDNKASGQDMGAALSNMTGDDRAELMGRKFDIEETEIKESHDTLRTMLEADASSPHTTRPRIAWWSFVVLAIVSVGAVLIWGYGVVSEKKDLAKAVVDGWPFVLSIVAPFVVLLRAYFGILTKEQNTRLQAAGGNTQPAGLAGLIGSILSKR